MISIRYQAPKQSGVQRVAYRFNEHLSAFEIARQVSYMSFHANGFPWERAFSPSQRDTLNSTLKMWATDVIGEDGGMYTNFTNAEDVVLVRQFARHRITNDTVFYDLIEHTFISDNYFVRFIDTIAYVPNSIIRAAEARIIPAYERGDYKTCYEAFDSAYIFIPITGAEWRSLKEQGIE